jgi:group I intron endonuclease
MSDRKKELKEEYKQNHRAMGVYQIRNLVNEKVFIGVSLDMQGVLNRHQFSLKMGNHRNKKLQEEWNEYGSENFVFETLDEIQPVNNPDYDARADLIFFEDMWLEKLQPYGERGYNEKKKTKEERLRMIAENRLNQE